MFIFREYIKGNVEGELNVGVVNVGFKVLLNKFLVECNDVLDIVIKYYVIDLLDKLLIIMEDLILVIEDFFFWLKKFNCGKGIFMKVRFFFEIYIICDEI